VITTTFELAADGNLVNIFMVRSFLKRNDYRKNKGK
jgi:hypothetical protein